MKFSEMDISISGCLDDTKRLLEKVVRPLICHKMMSHIRMLSSCALKIIRLNTYQTNYFLHLWSKTSSILLRKSMLRSKPS